MNPVEILTIKNKITLYKGEDTANSIELIELEEVGFQIVAQKDLYSIGDKAIYIQPDYCVPDISLFESYIRPFGDPKKSKLGSNNRIRAVKFNLHKGDGNPVYSQGILLPYNEVVAYINTNHHFKGDKLERLDLTLALNITKWEEPENNKGKGVNVSGKPKPWLSFLYKTDEENINNLWNKIHYPITLVGREKIDGSSITIGIKDGEIFICSRNINKPIFIKKVTGRRKKTFFEKLLFWTNPDLNIYEWSLNREDDFVNLGMPYATDLKYLSSGNMVLRGELNGQGLKGSGNKNNPSVKEQPNIRFFGIDYLNNGVFKKVDNNTFELEICNLAENSNNTYRVCTKVFERTFNSREEIEKACNDYFKDNLIEGIVIRSIDSTFSAKVLNLEYDSKK